MHRMAEDLVEPQPAVLVTGSWLTVKEQMADRYAAALAARGYTAFTFDFAGFGASGGGPRQAELPARKIEDIAAAARAVATLSFVRPGAIGYLAICASAQYAVRAIAGGAPIASLASVAGWFHDAASVAPFYGGTDGVALRLHRASEAFEVYQRSGEVRTVPAYQAGNDRAGMFFELDYYDSNDRGAVPTWTNEMAEFSWAYWLTFDGLSAAPAVSVPTLLVHGDGCVLPDNAREVARRVAGPTEVVWVDGGQTDFYDRDEQVGLAVDAADRHFRATLPGS
jgi:fermentation-respiration switch protein FrsA (DUF1100 family)